METFAVNIHRVLSSLKLQHEEITHIYVVGSRLWGTDSESSDFDLLVIARSLSHKVPRSQHKTQCDITLLTAADLTERAKQGSLIETVCCLLDGDERCVLRRGEPLKHLVRDISTVEEWVAERHLVDREKAKKFWLKEKREAAYKILQHMIMAEYLTRGLKTMATDAAGRLECIELTVQEIQEFVQRGRDANDRSWIGLGWDEVELLHTARLEGRG